MRRLMLPLICALTLLGATRAIADEKVPLQLLPPWSDGAPPAAAPAPADAGPPAAECECPPFDWSKLPPVRPLPRLGWFIPPPEYCGYYSLVDVFRRRQREASLPGLVPPGEQLLRPQIVPARHLRDHHPRRQALGHDPRLRLGAPAPPTQRPGDHLEPPNLTNLRVNPTVKS